MSGDPIEPTLEDYIARLQDADPDVRLYAAWVLGRQRDLRTVAPLIDAIDDPDPQVRTRVVESLGNLRDERAIDPLIGAMQDDSPQVRVQAVASCGRQGDLRALAGVIVCLKDDEQAVRVAAAETLGMLPDAQAVEPLIMAILHDEDSDVRFFAARSLANIGGTKTVDALLPHIQGKDADLDAAAKIYIAEVLGGLFDQRAVAPLQHWANDDDEGVRETVKWALNRLGR